MCRLKGHLSIIDYQRKSKVTIKLPKKTILERIISILWKDFLSKLCRVNNRNYSSDDYIKKGGVRHIRQRCYHGTKITYLHFCIDDLAL